MNRFRMPAIVLAFLSIAFETAFAASQGSSEVTLREGTRISLQLNDHLSTKLNIEGDTFTANVIVPVYHGDRVVISKESVVTGSVSRILRPGRFRGKAAMNVIFHSIRIPGKAQLSIVASIAAVEPEGNAGVKSEGAVEAGGSKGRDAGRVAKPGLTGAAIGGIVGGGKGAAIGSGVGAAIGLATVFATRGKDLEIRRGSSLEIVLDRPLVVPIDPEASVTKNR